MAIDISQIKVLRDATGVSMTACKSALEEANGDFDLAVGILRKKGEAKAAARSERVTENGFIKVQTLNGKTAMVALGCETDFVTRSDDFSKLASLVLEKLFSGEINIGDKDVSIIKDAVLKLGENIQIVNMVMFDSGLVGSYVHSNNKIGVLVELEGGSEEIAKDIAMHAAATSPVVLSPNEISSELVEKEKAIWTEQLASEGKPAAIIEKIMQGKEAKFRGENALLTQPFVKNPDITVEKFASNNGAVVKKFVRFAV